MAGKLHHLKYSILCIFSSPDLQSEKHRRMLYSMEMEHMAENAKTQMEDVSHIQTDFVTATQIGHVKTMFKVIPGVSSEEILPVN